MLSYSLGSFLFFFFFNDTATTEIYTLSLHDALPIFSSRRASRRCAAGSSLRPRRCSYPTSVWLGNAVAIASVWRDRKSTRLNSSHSQISYAVFCLKKKKKKNKNKR